MENEFEKKILDWLDNIVGVPAKELSLLVSDSVRKWRFNNQLRILKSAQEKCRKRNISLKVISPKLLCPLLDFASLEDDEILQDKWSNLLVNMLDSRQNIQNHVFPFILSQISKNELIELDKHYATIKDEIRQITLQRKTNSKELRETKISWDTEREKLIKLHGDDSLELEMYHDKAWPKLNDLYLESFRLYEELKTLRNQSMGFVRLENYEFANLMRLGVIINIPSNRITTQKKNGKKIFDVRHVSFDYGITELGEMFLEACEENV